MTGSGSSGSHTSSMRLASPQTATSTMPSSASDRLAAATCGAPPSTTSRVGGVGEPAGPALLRGDALLVAAILLILEVAREPPAHDLGHRGGVVGAVGDGET